MFQQKGRFPLNKNGHCNYLSSKENDVHWSLNTNIPRQNALCFYTTVDLIKEEFSN
jgi:hypothetical protein